MTCPHSEAADVRLSTGELVARICTSCDAALLSETRVDGDYDWIDGLWRGR